MQSQSNANGTDQNSSNISKRTPYIIGGAFVCGIIGYYCYNYLQQISYDKNHQNGILKKNGIKQQESNSQFKSKQSQPACNTQTNPSSSKAKPKPKSKQQSNGIIVKYHHRKILKKSQFHFQLHDYFPFHFPLHADSHTNNE